MPENIKEMILQLMAANAAFVDLPLEDAWLHFINGLERGKSGAKALFDLAWLPLFGETPLRAPFSIL